MARPERFELPT